MLSDRWCFEQRRNVDGMCDPGIGSKKWAPKVFYPKKKIFHNEVGLLPNYMLTLEEVRPLCKNVEMVNSSEVLVVGNGSLLLPEKHIMINKIEDYCVDQTISPVCLPDREFVPDNIAIISWQSAAGHIKSIVSITLQFRA